MTKHFLCFFVMLIIISLNYLCRYHGRHCNRHRHIKPNRESSAAVRKLQRAVKTVSKHIILSYIAKAIIKYCFIIRIYKSSRFGVIVAGLQIIQPRFGWILLCAQERLSPSCALLFRAVPAEKANVTALYQVPASIAIVIPQRQNLSGVLLKPLRAWDYPGILPSVPKRRCLLV